MTRIRIEERGLPPRVLHVRRRPAAVGRDEDNDIVLDHGYVSGRHGELFVQDDALAYADLGSTNGSIVVRGDETHEIRAGRRNAIVVRTGDRIILGDRTQGLSLVLESVVDTEEAAPPTLVVSRSSVDRADEILARCDSAEALGVLCRFAQRAARAERESELLGSLAAACLELFSNATHVTLVSRPEPSAPPNTDREASTPKVRVFSRGQSSPEPGPPPSGIALQVKERHEAVLVADADQPTAEADALRAAAIRSMIAAPTGKKPGDWDILQVENRAHPESFAEHDLERLTLLAAHATVSLARLRRESALRAKGQRLAQANRYLRESSAVDLCESPVMTKILGELGTVLDSNISVLITGETGTGKEVVARYLHERGLRSGGLFVPVHCAGLANSTLEDELLGRRFEIAHHGTIFIDEITDMSASMQTKLLRVLETGEIEPSGAGGPRPLSVRVLSATQRDLQREVAAGRFRADLYYRLALYQVHLPPLRERRQDVLPLARYFLTRFTRTRDGRTPEISSTAADVLMHARWPGNVRELRNEIERAAFRMNGAPELDASHIHPLPPADRENGDARCAVQIPVGDASFRELERQIYEAVLRIHDGRQTRAAKALGLKYTTFRFRAKRAGAL